MEKHAEMDTNKHSCFSRLLLLLFLICVFAHCKKKEPEPTQPTSTKGSLVVWSNDSDTRGIAVFINSEHKGDITKRYSSTPGCGASGCVNLELEAGNYQLKIYGPRSNQTSDANVTIKKGECVALQVP